MNYNPLLPEVRADRSLVPQLIEEVLRYDGPVQGIFRVAVREVELAGTTIPAGAGVFYLNGSANRDECKYTDPDRFDVLRNPRDHLAFGYGIHYCLGAQLVAYPSRPSGLWLWDSLLPGGAVGARRGQGGPGCFTV
jgi:cytochrome P450